MGTKVWRNQRLTTKPSPIKYSFLMTLIELVAFWPYCHPFLLAEYLQWIRNMDLNLKLEKLVKIWDEMRSEVGETSEDLG